MAPRRVGRIEIKPIRGPRYQDLNKSTAQVTDRSQQVGHVLSRQVEHRRQAEPEALARVSVPRTRPLSGRNLKLLVEQADIVIAGATQVA